MFDNLFLVILVLNTTGLFRFLAPQVGVEISQISLALLGLHGVYLVVRRRYLVPLLRLPDMKYLLLVLFIWPLLTVLYAPALKLREIGLQLYYVSLLCGAVVFTMANGLPSIYRVMTVSLVVTVLGLVLSLMAPDYFCHVALLADASTNYMDRAYGFFMQPNSLAIGFTLLFIGWYSLWKDKGSLLEVAALVTFLGVMLLTGSRTGILVATMVVTLIVIYSWRKGWSNATASRRLYAKALALSVCLIGGVAAVNHYASSAYFEEGTLLDRISTLASFRLSDRGGIKQDGSIQERLDAQAVYWSLIQTKPLWGHGLGAEAHYYENGPIDLTSHSTLLTCWMEYGIFYPIAFGLLMVRLYMNRNRGAVEAHFKTNSVLQFVLVALFLFTIAGCLLAERGLYVVLGMFFAAVYYPRYVVENRHSAGPVIASPAAIGRLSAHLARNRRIHFSRGESAIPRLSGERLSR